MQAKISGSATPRPLPVLPLAGSGFGMRVLLVLLVFLFCFVLPVAFDKFEQSELGASCRNSILKEKELFNFFFPILPFPPLSFFVPTLLPFDKSSELFLK